MILSTSTNTLYERADGSRIPVEESIRQCAAAGYQTLDFCFVDQITMKTSFLGDHWKEYLLSLRKLAEDLGVTFVQSHGVLYDFCNAPNEEQEELARRCVEGSHLLGIPWMVMHPFTKVTDGKMDPSTPDINVEFFKKLADYGKDFGVGVAVENMWGRTREGVRRYTVEPEEVCDLVDRIDAPNVGVCWDAEHGSIEGIDQGAALRMVGSRLKALHISDQTSPVDIHILPYMGVTDWDEVLEALAAIGYENPFTYEIQHYLLRLPLEFVPSALRLSYEVGVYMVDRLQTMKEKMASGT
jgi:sugar phosphate isomerase/epimerase